MITQTESFIDEALIFEVLDENIYPDKRRVCEIIEKARELKGLSLEETAVLLQAEDFGLIEEIFHAAREIKFGIYGKRLVLFAPLYITNECTNNCLYCAFRRDNKDLMRKTLSIEEVQEEVRILEEMGHKRLLLVYGESSGMDYIVDTIDAVYSTRIGNGEIRRVNVNLAPLTTADFKVLKSTGIGTYQCFQETYHRETYRKMHPSGRKSVFEWRLFAVDRAQQAGIDDVALGVLFGLFDWKFEVLALLMHAEHLDRSFGVGPHTISFPRIEPALNSDVANNPPCPVSDRDFKRLVAILRLAVPYTGMILTTREPAELRREVFNLGVSQISAGSRTHPGGYSEVREHAPEMEQFTLGDTRPLDEVIRDMAAMGYIPSFCTACYRRGRTGADFMALAKPGLIQKYCLPNALLTFKEYLVDYASENTRAIGDKTIIEQIKDIPGNGRLKETLSRLNRVESGERDIYF
ncbi:MAG: [FeFe] hydrogenase H-cluster radical SAM maturase HydG [bacterium]